MALEMLVSLRKRAFGVLLARDRAGILGSYDYHDFVRDGDFI